MSKSACGKPPKSWIVGGRSIAVMPTPRVHQCADTAKMARGRPISRPIRAQARVQPLSAKALRGVPWPKKTEGILANSSDIDMLLAAGAKLMRR